MNGKGWLVGLGLLAAALAGAYAGVEMSSRHVAEQVTREIIIQDTLPVSPSHYSHRKATLDDVRRDWGITGRLECHSVIEPSE